eukprot:TRINITY_DN7549_c0_g1_i2.p1 TRINITY_DN7549_c0_g1~~TRINITY_DN7549_c0_g1_i2.p1  ORF type:complete len:117 (-),score=21.04 TRINITY_DN7549_c0_g1_i2:80-430(-)
MVKELLSVPGVDPNVHQPHTNNTALHLALGSPAIIAALLNSGASPNEKNTQGNTPLHLACAAGNLPAVQALISSESADVHIANLQNRTPFHLAIIGNHQHVVKAMREHYLDLDDDD